MLTALWGGNRLPLSFCCHQQGDRVNLKDELAFILCEGMSGPEGQKCMVAGGNSAKDIMGTSTHSLAFPSKVCV